MNEIYSKIPFKNVPVEKFGKCPICASKYSKIQWGWASVYYDMICENGHQWKYNDNRTGNE